MTTTELLVWADQHCPAGAAFTRQAATRPGEYARCLARLKQLWWEWGARIWASWPPERRREQEGRADGLERGGVTRLEAERMALLEIAQGQVAAWPPHR